tara:strand:+ start:11872 stop:12519 length:648 start_codon:yes stop_codon:yes gene_type:complete
MTFSRLPANGAPLRRAIGAGIFIALYCALISSSGASEKLFLEYLVFTHQQARNVLPERDTSQNRLLAVSALSSNDTHAQSRHSLISGSGLLQQHNVRLKENPFYRVTLHAKTEFTKSGDTAAIRFRIKRAATQDTSDIRIHFQCGGSPKRQLTTNVVYVPFPEAVATPDEEHRQGFLGARLEPWILRDSRRLKIGEVHYLDHPAFGILLIVAEKN